MDINPETSDKKMLLDKIIKLIPKNEINDLMKKFRNELSQKDSTVTSNEIEEEKNHSEDPNKILTNATDHILLESENQENFIKEENIDKKLLTQKTEPKEKNVSLEIINLLQKENEKLKMNNINEKDKKDINTGLNMNNQQNKQIPITNSDKNQKKEKEEEDDDYWIENLKKEYQNNTTPNINQNQAKNISQNQNQTLPQNQTQNKYLTKKRRADLQEELNSNPRVTNRRTNNINYNNNTQINNNIVEQTGGSKEKQILGKMIEKRGFLSVFNLLTKSNFNRNDPLEKYIDDLISNMGLLKVSLILFQIYFENQINSEKQKALNKREDTSDIMIDIDNDYDIPELNNNNMPNNYSSNMNMRMNMNNFQNNNYQTNMNPIPYTSQNYSKNNNNYNQMRGNNNINNIISEPNIMGNIPYNNPNMDSNEKNVSNYFNNNFNYDQKKVESKKKENKSSFSLKSTGLSLHFHKDEMGNVYKYSKHHFFGKDICVFYCCDKECRATANYFMNTLRFVLVNKHNKEYNDHIYIQKPDRDRKVMDDLKKRPEHEGQMFKRPDGSKLVKWYDML